MKKTSKIKALKIIMTILLIIASVLFLSSNSFAEDDAPNESSGFMNLLLLLFRGLLAVILFAISFTLGILIGGQFTSLNVETFIFNKYDLTSLNVFLGDTSNSIANDVYDSVVRWFSILFSIALALQLLILIYIAISTALKTLKQDPEKDAEVKVMLKDFLLGLGILAGMVIFIITIIFLNNTLVKALERAMDYESTVLGVTIDGVTNKVFLDIFSFDAQTGTISLILYIILATMGVFFFVYYLRRFIKVSFLILISPLVAVTFSLDRRKGSAQKLITWAKMFVYAVLIQSVHALIYTALIYVVVESIDLNTTNFVATVIILVSGLKFLWDAETIVGELFGIQADEVKGSAAFLLGFMSRAKGIKSASSKVADKVPMLATGGKKSLSGKSTPKLADGAKELGDSKDKKKSKDDVKDKDKTKDRSKDKDKDDTKDKPKKKMTKEEMEKARVKAERKAKLAEAIDTHMPLKGLGDSVKKSINAKAKTIKNMTFKQVAGSSAKRLAQVVGGGVASIASHATPQIGMIEAGIVGAAASGWAVDGVSDYRDKKKHDGKSKSYKKTLDKEADQLIAINDRKAKLGNEFEKEDGGESIEEVKEVVPDLDEGKDSEPQKEIDKTDTDDADKKDEKDEKEIEDKDKTQKAIDEAIEKESSSIESYAKDIAEKSTKEITDAYDHARKESLVDYQERTGKSLDEAKRHVITLQKEILKNQDFNYEILEEVDRNLLHKYLNYVAKQKSDNFENKTGKKIKYKEVAKRANERLQLND